MTLYDLIMGGKSTRDDWAQLGAGQITDQATIDKMLMEGYAALADED